MRTLVIFVLLAVATLAAGPAVRSKAAPAVSDAVIEQNIRARFAKSKISSDKFTVRVQGGVAVVEGSTNIVQRKGVATRLAKAGGAVSVDNRIRIGEDARRQAAEKLAEHRRPAARSAAPAPRAASQAVVTHAAPPAVKPEVPAETKTIPRAQIKR
jgi:hypothetical protein